MTIVNAVAAIENVEPIDLPTTLYDLINPEALDTLVANESNIMISFTLDEYGVQIDGNRLVISFN